MIRTFTVLGASTLALAVTAAAPAETLVTSSTVAADPSTRAYADTDPYFGGFIADRVTITGLDKFDPALGTLTGVALSINFDFDYDLTPTSGTVTDTGQDHAASAGFTTDHRAVVAFRPDVATTNLVVSPNPLPTLTAGTSATPGSETTAGSGTLSATLLDITGSVDLAEFVGTGDVTALIAATYLPYSAQFTLDNVDSATVAASASRSAGTVSLQYTYIVPEPASLALAGLGALALVRRRRVR